jgi:hypothetical protein
MAEWRNGRRRDAMAWCCELDGQVLSMYWSGININDESTTNFAGKNLRRPDHSICKRDLLRDFFQGI